MVLPMVAAPLWGEAVDQGNRKDNLDEVCIPRLRGLVLRHVCTDVVFVVLEGAMQTTVREKPAINCLKAVDPTDYSTNLPGKTWCRRGAWLWWANGSLGLGCRLAS